MTWTDKGTETPKPKMVEYILVDGRSRAAVVKRAQINFDVKPVNLPNLARFSAYAIIDRSNGVVLKHNPCVTLPDHADYPSLPEAWPVRGRSMIGDTLASLVQTLSGTLVSKQGMWLTIDYRASNGFRLIPPKMIDHFIIHPDDQAAIYVEALSCVAALIETPEQHEVVLKLAGEVMEFMAEREHDGFQHEALSAAFGKLADMISAYEDIHFPIGEPA